MIVRAGMRGAVIDMNADAETKLGVLVDDGAFLGLVRAHVLGTEIVVLERARNKGAYRLAAAGHGLRLQRLANIGCQLVERIGHRFTPSCICPQISSAFTVTPCPRGL